MHVPDHFRPAGPRVVTDIVTDNPFALVVTASRPWPIATHAPVVAAPAEPDAPWPGRRLYGHIARDNPHADLLHTNPRALVIFSAPHGYISPTAYRKAPAAPTWNYAAVHLECELEIVSTPAGALDVVERTIKALESDRVPSWDPVSSSDYFARIVEGITAFKLTVLHSYAIVKHSQDKPETIQRQVIDHLEVDGNGLLAKQMSKTLGLD